MYRAVSVYLAMALLYTNDNDEILCMKHITSVFISFTHTIFFFSLSHHAGRFVVKTFWYECLVKKKKAHNKHHANEYWTYVLRVRFPSYQPQCTKQHWNKKNNEEYARKTRIKIVIYAGVCYLFRFVCFRRKNVFFHYIDMFENFNEDWSIDGALNACM